MAKFDSNENLLQSVKSMSIDELNTLAEGLRKELIEDVSKTGGHLASNLGVVELTIALHYVFDSPKDKIIWDVGHQTYVHKMLTGRREELKSIRQFGGISGFPKREESVHDMFDSGHSATSVSVCLGYAKARDIKNENYSCIAVIGDGALTGGVAWEALNSAGVSKTPMIVILNDNGMSISGNVGGVSKHLNKLRTSEAYNNFKKSVKNAGNQYLQQSLGKIRDSLKYALVPGVIFEELGFKYYGPIDGNDLSELIDALTFVKTLDRPVLLHVKTKKGMGFIPAEKNPSKFHGIGSFDPETVTALSERNKFSWSEIFGDELSKSADSDSDIIAITAAMADGTGLKQFQIMHPGKFFDAGIAEQHAVSFAAGAALNGLKPVVALYSTFMQRAYDQILTEVCLQKLPIVFAVDRAGITGQDGETHQGEFDIAFLRSMPDMTLLSPRDESSLRAMLRYALSLNSPAAIRYPRGTVPRETDLFPVTEEFYPTPQLIRYGEDILFISDGNMLKETLKAADVLRKKGLSVGVCDLRIIKPLPEKFLSDTAKNYRAVISVEDGCMSGGFGEAIAAMFSSKNLNKPFINIAWPDRFIEHGSVAELREEYGMNAEAIAKKAGIYFEKTFRYFNN